MNMRFTGAKSFMPDQIKPAAAVFLYAAICFTASTAYAQNSLTRIAQNDAAQHLTNNTCFMQLQDRDKVIVTAAFHSGAEGFKDLQQLVDRRPWGEALTSVQREEINKLKKEASPFLIMTLSKKQALVLEDHRFNQVDTGAEHNYALHLLIRQQNL